MLYPQTHVSSLKDSSVWLKSFYNFKFGDTLFSKIMPNICKPHTKSIHKIQQFPWNPIIFGKIKLTLYPQVRNSMTHPTDNIMHGRKSTKIIDIMILI